jgi:hypothetical protein
MKIPTMTQQVLRQSLIFEVMEPTMYRPTIDIIWEALGSASSVDISGIDGITMTFLEGTVSAQATAMTAYMSKVLQTSGTCLTINYYDITAHLDGSAAGSPIETTTHTWSTGPENEQQLPEEIACCFSYRADYGSAPEFGPGKTRPRASLRGRFYLGPFGILAAGENSNDAFAWKSTFLTDALYAFNGLLGGYVSGSHQDQPVQWSRKTATVSHITEYAINNLPDRRARRELKAPNLSWISV